jgi:hypothetical protein
MLAIVLSACSGLHTFSQAVRPGDTVAVAIDWQPSVSAEKATVVIRDSTGFVQSFTATDPVVRGWINLYPDPVSKVVVGRETAQALGVTASAYGIGVENETGGDKDWFETVLFVDLPLNLSSGDATIDIQVAGGSVLQQPVAVNVLPLAEGAPHPFDTYEWGPLSSVQLSAMERADHYTVSFSGPQVPAAIQVELNHDPDQDNSGTGQAYVIPPRGDLKSINWTDTGTVLRVLIAPAWHKTVEDADRTSFNAESMNWSKFYVAGGVTGLQVNNVQAFDMDGNPIAGISASVQ